MKQKLLAAALLAFAGAASAAPSLSWTELAEAGPSVAAPYNRNGDGFNPDSGLTYNGTSFVTDVTHISLGRVSALATGSYKVTYTYLGKEASYPNEFYAKFTAPEANVTFKNTPETPIGTSVSVTGIGSGLLPFAFEGYTNSFARNNGVWDANTSVGLIGENYSFAGSGVNHLGAGTYAFILGYNDTYTPHNDWDDMVIGVNIAPTPEPETYAMLLAGLGLMGFVARRRKQSTSI